MIGGGTLSIGDGNGLGSRVNACDGIVIDMVEGIAGASDDERGDGNIGTVKTVVDSLLCTASLSSRCVIEPVKLLLFSFSSGFWSITSS